jgi:hypothetical protein
MPNERNEIEKIGQRRSVEEERPEACIVDLIHVEGERPHSSPDHAFIMTGKLERLRIQGEILGTLIEEELLGIQNKITGGKKQFVDQFNECVIIRMHTGNVNEESLNESVFRNEM